MNLDGLRKQIDALDEKLVGLLNERVDVALNIGKIKKEQGGEIYVPSREKAVFERIETLNGSGPLPDKSARAIYREIMSAALAIESNLKITYLGPPATYTKQATRSEGEANERHQTARTISYV